MTKKKKAKQKRAGGIAFYVRQGALDKKSLKKLTETLLDIMEAKVCESSLDAEALVKVQAIKALTKMQQAQPVHINAGTVTVK